MCQGDITIVSLLLVGFLAWAHVGSCEGPDQTTMVAISKEIGVPSWSVSNHSDYCRWRGVLCGSDQRVMMLDISSHWLQGNISLISQLKSLKRLDLSINHFTGQIPAVLGQLSELEVLDLSSNKFVGQIPRELANLRNLRALNLSFNLLVGAIPEELQGLAKLQEFQISGNKLTGSIPNWVANLTSLRVFTAYENSLVGKIPEKLGSFSELEQLNLQSNQLNGPIPDSLFANGKLQILVLTENKLTGSIPESIGNCVNLSSIRIGDNNLMGSIPKTVGNITSLTYFEANNNHLSAEIVLEFANCSNLTLLNLASNGFSGIVPSELGQLVNLQELIVSGNTLSGDIPGSILHNRNLTKLDLRNNRFNGTIPLDICKDSTLQFLLLSQNSIRGEIPREIGDCVKLLDLQLASNYLTGQIPPEIGRLENLQIGLNLSFNDLQGQLPVSLGKLDKLVSLDVSNNQLSGPIPGALKGMMSLIEVNFSHNHFAGPIPIFAPFQKSQGSSFEGNKGLCGPPVNSCSPSTEHDHGRYSSQASYRAVLAVIGSSLAVFCSVVLIVLLFMLREKRERSAKDIDTMDDTHNSGPLTISGSVFHDNFKQAIDFEAVVKATFKDENKLSSGTFSTVYKATMPSGLILMVRSLKSVDKTVIHHQNKMIKELERLGRLSHDHLLKLIGFVIYEDVALLLHEYMCNGNLAQFIHQKSKMPEYEPDWPARLAIAIGVAQGLAFLHSVAVVHLDICSGNVLLDANLSPRVAEIEIVKLLDPSKGTAASISAVAGSFGYIPPEYAYIMQVTAPGNVYSYGVVLLEILTTRLPVDEAFGEGVDLVKWVHSAPLRGETPELILDPRLSTVSFAWRKQMVAALKLALECTDSTPAKRPKMKKVVEMLLEIKQN